MPTMTLSVSNAALKQHSWDRKGRDLTGRTASPRATSPSVGTAKDPREGLMVTIDYLGIVDSWSEQMMRL